MYSMTLILTRAISERYYPKLGPQVLYTASVHKRYSLQAIYLSQLSRIPLLQFPPSLEGELREPRGTRRAATTWFIDGGTRASDKADHKRSRRPEPSAHPHHLERGGTNRTDQLPDPKGPRAFRASGPTERSTHGPRGNNGSMHRTANCQNGWLVQTSSSGCALTGCLSTFACLTLPRRSAQGSVVQSVSPHGFPQLTQGQGPNDQIP